MTLPKSAQKRPYLNHGQYALDRALKTIGNQDGWIESLGEMGEALQDDKQVTRMDCRLETSTNILFKNYGRAQ